MYLNIIGKRISVIMIKVFLLGDSIVTAYGKDSENFIGGWGDHLGSFFDDKFVSVISCAEGGESSRSFLNDGRFIDNGLFTKEMFPQGVGPCYELIREGDFVFIQFCHNDDDSARHEKRELRHTPLGTPDSNGIYPTVLPIGNTPYSFECGATYKGYLKFYIDKIRKRGAAPVLLTPPPRGVFIDGKIASVPGNHGGTDEFGEYAYIRAIRQVGETEDVTVLELFERSKNYINSIGEENFKYLQSLKDGSGNTIGESRYGRPKAWPQDYNEIMQSGEFGEIDNTHQNRFGSFVYAGFIAEEIREKIPTLAKFLLEESSKNVPPPEGFRL